MSNYTFNIIVRFIIFNLFTTIAISANWTTWGFDDQRSGFNPYEKDITKTGAKSLKNSWSVPMNGGSISQPLYLKGVKVAGKIRNVVFVSTENGFFYAIDTSNGVALWTRSLGYTTNSNTNDVPNGHFGIGGTAYIDIVRNKIYVSSNGALYSLNIADGKDEIGWPITAVYDPALYHNYGAISKLGNTIYMTLGSQGDQGRYFGQVLGYDVTSRVQVAKYQASFPAPLPAGGYGGGIWSQAGVSIPVTGGAVFTATGI